MSLFYKFQGNLVLVGYKEALAVHNLATGEALWRVVRPSRSELPITRPLFLSETFCGYLYHEGFDFRKYKAKRRSKCMVGHIRVTMYDTKTGVMIDDICCWRASLHYYNSDYDNMPPIARVSGMHLCILGISDQRTPHQCYDKVFCMRIAQRGTDSTQFHVDETRLIDVREIVLKKYNMPEKSSQGRKSQFGPELPFLDFSSRLGFWGAWWPENLIFFDFKFRIRQESIVLSEKQHKVILVLDLRRALDPACIEASDAFTLPFTREPVKWSTLRCYVPMFKTSEGRVMLSGALEYTH
jgi:hypothetical protein